MGRAFCDAPDCQFEYGPACDANAVPSGANTTSVPRPRLGSVLYGGGGITQCTQAGTLALTYDDGPYIYTSELLDILQENDVPATFFITSVNLNKGEIDNSSTAWPEILRRMVSEGHQVASHTWSHQNLNEITSSERVDQLVKNEMAFRNVLGYFPTYMRPPYNTCLRDAGCVGDLETLGYHIVSSANIAKLFKEPSDSRSRSSGTWTPWITRTLPRTRSRSLKTLSQMHLPPGRSGSSATMTSTRRRSGTSRNSSSTKAKPGATHSLRWASAWETPRKTGIVIRLPEAPSALPQRRSGRTGRSLPRSWSKGQVTAPRQLKSELQLHPALPKAEVVA